jgi:hypothetical protein
MVSRARNTSLIGNIIIQNTTYFSAKSIFSGCNKLTTAIEIPDKVTIMSSAFNNCTSLTNLPDKNASYFTTPPLYLSATDACYRNDTLIATPITYDNIPTTWK